MTQKLCFVASFLFVVGFQSSHAEAKKAPKSACGIQYFPMSIGSTWSYEFIVPPGVTEKAGLKVDPPSTITLNVQDVKQEGSETVITIIEQYRNVVQSMIFRCDKKGLRIPVESFFFSGEPGGARGVTLVEPSIKGDFFPARSLKKGDSLFVELKANLAHGTSDDGVVHAKGRIEMERQLNVGNSTQIETGMGPMKATGVEIKISGRIFLDDNKGKENNMPAIKSTMWFAPGTGLVQVFNRFGHGWKLKTMTNTAGN